MKIRDVVLTPVAFSDPPLLNAMGVQSLDRAGEGLAVARQTSECNKLGAAGGGRPPGNR
jgi:hypothetical protein